MPTLFPEDRCGLRLPSSAMPLQLAVVDDNDLFRRTLKRLIGRQPALSLVGEAGDGAQMTELFAQCRPELLFLDMEVGPHSGFELLPQALAVEPGLAVIFLTGHDPVGLQSAALAAGARACWSKNDLRPLLDGLAGSS